MAQMLEKSGHRRLLNLSKKHDGLSFLPEHNSVRLSGGLGQVFAVLSPCTSSVNSWYPPYVKKSWMNLFDNLIALLAGKAPYVDRIWPLKQKRTLKWPQAIADKIGVGVKEVSMSHVLVIDDDLNFRRAVRLAVEQEGFAVVEADGREGLLSAQRSSPALILLDLRMPGMSGLQILHALRSDVATASIPVIVVSATTDDDVTRETIKLGAAGYLYKTHFSMPELRELVRQHLPKKSVA